MEEGTCKRKRSPQDLNVRKNNILNYFESIKEELNEIEEPYEKIEILDQLMDISRVKKPRVLRSFSNVSKEELQKAGVEWTLIAIRPTKLTELTNERMTMEANAEIVDLHSRIKKIYARVNLNSAIDLVSGTRSMITDAILLSLAEIYSTQQKEVAILPQMIWSDLEEVEISNHSNGYVLSLSGKVDYAIIEYDDMAYKRELLDDPTTRINAFNYAKSCLLVVQVKYLPVEGSRYPRDFNSYKPEATGQAIALLKYQNLPEVRFCITDGEKWAFNILKSEDGTLTSYKSQIYTFSKESLEKSDLPLRDIMLLLCEWLNPTMPDLYKDGLL